jgi:hypothetical protein
VTKAEQNTTNRAAEDVTLTPEEERRREVEDIRRKLRVLQKRLERLETQNRQATNGAK